MLGLYEIYSQNKVQNANLDLQTFLVTIRSKLESIRDIPADKDGIKDQEFSKKEIALLLQFFIFLAYSTNHIGVNDVKRSQILGLFGDESGEPPLEMALEKISSRIDQLLNFSSEEGKISKELNSSISDFINNHLPKSSEQVSPDQETPSPKEIDPQNVDFTIASPVSKSESKHEDIDYYMYMEKYNQILTQEKEFAKKLNKKEENNLSPEKYSGIGASVEMISNENGQITEFRVLSVVENSHAQDLGLENEDILQLNTPVGINEINATVNKIRNLYFSDVKLTKKDGSSNTLTLNRNIRRQFFSTNVNEDKITMISADKAGINKDKKEQVARELDFSIKETPKASPEKHATLASPPDPLVVVKRGSGRER